MYTGLIKPLFDFIFAVVILLFSSPILLFTMLLLWVSNKGKIWFFQQRPGRHGKIFTIVKFKTMTDRRNEKGEPLPDINRLTKVGKWIRKMSVDELPQLINVLKGDMSFVGPRPLLVEYLPLYNCLQSRRHEVKPGITGWAQVNGRNALSWKSKFELDIWYVDNQSFLLDLKILILTVFRVFKADGINATESIPMEKFKGNA